MLDVAIQNCSPAIRRIPAIKSSKRILRPLRAALGVVLLHCAVVQASSPIEIREMFVELHTSPGRGYPVFDVAQRGEQVEVIEQRTNWFMVRNTRGHVGWVPESQLRSSLDAAGPTPAPADHS